MGEAREAFVCFALLPFAFVGDPLRNISLGFFVTFLHVFQSVSVAFKHSSSHYLGVPSVDLLVFASTCAEAFKKCRASRSLAKTGLSEKRHVRQLWPSFCEAHK